MGRASAHPVMLKWQQHNDKGHARPCHVKKETRTQQGGGPPKWQQHNKEGHAPPRRIKNERRTQQGGPVPTLSC